MALEVREVSNRYHLGEYVVLCRFAPPCRHTPRRRHLVHDRCSRGQSRGGISARTRSLRPLPDSGRGLLSALKRVRSVRVRCSHGLPIGACRWHGGAAVGDSAYHCAPTAPPLSFESGGSRNSNSASSILRAPMTVAISSSPGPVRIEILPHHATVRSDLEESSLSRFRHERVPIGQALDVPEPHREEWLCIESRVSPHDLLGHRIELLAPSG